MGAEAVVVSEGFSGGHGGKCREGGSSGGGSNQVVSQYDYSLFYTSDA